jgi:hypothetical protein
MWQYLGLVALDIANEKAREAEAQAERWRLSRLVAPTADPRPSLARRTAAVALRRFSDASYSMSEAACEAASRLEHRTA